MSNPYEEKTMQIQPYLFFEGRCDEALEFYRKAVDAEVTVRMRYKDSPEPGMHTAGMEDKVMHAEVRIGNTTLMASDGRCDATQSFQGFALYIAAPDQAKAERYFAALSEGGEVRMPLAKTFWSPCFGMTTDRFGILWMISVAA